MAVIIRWLLKLAILYIGVFLLSLLAGLFVPPATTMAAAETGCEWFGWVGFPVARCHESVPMASMVEGFLNLGTNLGNTALTLVARVMMGRGDVPWASPFVIAGLLQMALLVVLLLAGGAWFVRRIRRGGPHSHPK